jgi:ribose transport system ATP-binding protein
MSLLATKGLSKRYGAVVALRSADLVVEPGEVHALLGANGAGKSTLVKLLTGVIRPDAGTISIEDREVRVSSPRAAQRLGLAPVFQDPALVPDLTVAHNLRLTGADSGRVRGWLARMELDPVDMNALVSDLPLATLRMLDLARALSRDPQLLLLDEITAALPSDLAERVFGVIRLWKEQGRSVLFITHRLAEVIAVCDRATVLRDGRDVGTLIPTVGGEEQIVEYMLGPAAREVIAAQEEAAAPEVAATPAGAAAAVPRVPAPAAPPLEPILEVAGLSVGDIVRDVSLSLPPGEILGVAALEGQGQDALFEALAGDRRASAGDIMVAGKRLNARTPYDAIRAGLVLVPADRLQALLPQRSIRENVAAPMFNRVTRWGPINPREEGRRVRSAVERLRIDTRAQRQVRRLSGGNQQKVTIARWLASGFKVMLCFDPTRGIDVGTKRQIYALLRDLADAGAGILLFTSELPEIPLVCDRALVLYGGRIVQELPASEADEATLLRAAHGLVPTEEAVA